MTYSVSDAAQQAGVSIHTLHYYEREGLLTIQRSSSGHRRYSQDDMAWIGILTCLRETGMPIRTMRRFASLVQHSSSNIPERLEILGSHRCEVLAQLASLQKNLEHLDGKIAYYQHELLK